MGVQLQRVAYAPQFKVRDIVQLHDRLYGSSMTGLMDGLGIDGLLGKAYRQLSRGEKQRIDLYVALAHPADLVLLDEPSTGLDSGYEKAFLDAVAAIRSQRPQTAFLVASHRGVEVALADEVAWLAQGRLMRMGSLDVLLSSELGALKIELSDAYCCWHMARTPAVRQALPNAWLKAHGVVSVKDPWCKAQGNTAHGALPRAPTC